MLDDIAFAEVAFSEQALAIMSTRPGEHDGAAGANAGGGGGGSGSGGLGGAVGGGDNWDRRLARPENFLQLCRDDTCGKMKTLKVYHPPIPFGLKTSINIFSVFPPGQIDLDPPALFRFSPRVPLGCFHTLSRFFGIAKH